MVKTDNLKIQEVKKWLGNNSINVFGIPLSGKDTQCKLLAKALNAQTFGGGDILRNSKTSNNLKNEINNGKLAPTDEYLSLIIPYFSRPEFKDTPLVLSSIGRLNGEENVVIEAGNKSSHPIVAVILIDFSEEEAEKRLELASRGREDDTAEKLKVRFNEFREKTIPVIKHYESLGLLLKVNGNQSVEGVFNEIIDKLYSLASK